MAPSCELKDEIFVANTKDTADPAKHKMVVTAAGPRVRHVLQSPVPSCPSIFSSFSTVRVDPSQGVERERVSGSLLSTRMKDTQASILIAPAKEKYTTFHENCGCDSPRLKFSKLLLGRPKEIEIISTCDK